MVMLNKEYMINHMRNENTSRNWKKDEIEYYNSFQVLQSYRYVFGKKKEFQSVSDIVKHRPELKDINREKILMG